MRLHRRNLRMCVMCVRVCSAFQTVCRRHENGVFLQLTSQAPLLERKKYATSNELQGSNCTHVYVSVWNTNEFACEVLVCTARGCELIFWLVVSCDCQKCLSTTSWHILRFCWQSLSLACISTQLQNKKCINTCNE